MKFDYSVNITGICPELLCGMITAERLFYEFGEKMHVTVAGKTYVKCKLPEDEVLCDHLAQSLVKELPQNFSIDCNDQTITIQFNGGTK